jgi:hypothetical protein
MNRKEFLKRSVQGGFGTGALLVLNPSGAVAQAQEDPAAVKREKEFIENWLMDLLNTIGDELDEATQIKLIEGCGRGCYRRHQFKQDIAAQGKGDLEKLMAAYRKIFGDVEKKGDQVHIRFNTREHGCFCPVLKNKPSKIDGLHCHCHKMTHELVFQEALGGSFEVEVRESVRRGGERCHFVIQSV